MEENYPVMVSIECCVYNHEPYLRKCLDGFVMQKTNFPFEAIVHDDASTDGSAAIILEYAEKYPNIIKPIIETENQYSKGHGILRKFLDTLLKGKYIAWCEGDDYWVDPLKLQKQVDFMEEHPDYGLIHTMFDSTPIRRFSTNVPLNLEDNYLIDLLKRQYTIGSLTALYRRSLYESIPKYYMIYDFGRRDYPLWIELAHESKIKYLPDCTAVYRILENSMSHSKDTESEIRFHKLGWDCAAFYAKKYNVVIEFNMSYFYDACIKCAFNHKDVVIAKKYFKEAKNNKALSKKGRLFYYATQFPLLGYVIKAMYKYL